MLPRSQRLVASTDFAATVRRGRRIGRPTLVLHARPAEVTQVGFVVSKAVGGAVVRNRVKRRLRHLVGAELSRAGAPSAQVVVRALPAAATATDQLTEDLRSAWSKLEAQP